MIAQHTQSVLFVLLIIRQDTPFLIFHLQSFNALAFKVKKIKYKNINILNMQHIPSIPETRILIYFMPLLI